MKVKVIVMANVPELPKKQHYSFERKHFPAGIPKVSETIWHYKFTGEITHIVHRVNGTTFIPHIYVQNRSFGQTHKKDKYYDD